MCADVSSHYSSCTDSSSDYTSDSDTESPLTTSLANKILSMVPMPNNNNLDDERNKSRDLLSKTRNVYRKNKLTQSSPKRSIRVDAKKTIEDCFKDLQNDFNKMAKKFNSICETLPDLLTAIDSINSRVSASEDKIREIEAIIKSQAQTPSNPTPFRDALISCDSQQRLDKLEYAKSEEDRRKRSLEILITEPSLENASNLHENINILFSDKLQMERREIDSRMQVRKAKRANTAVITFSDIRFKKFAFRARKKLNEVSNSPSDIFLNDNLTPYNHKILMDLKKTRKSFNQDSDPFKSIYTFDGRVYVKLKNSSNLESQNVKNIEQLNALLNSVKPNPEAASSSSAPVTGTSASASTSAESLASGSTANH